VLSIRTIPPFALWVASFPKSVTSKSKIKSGSLEVRDHASSNHNGKQNAYEPYAMFLPAERIHKPLMYVRTGKSVPASSFQPQKARSQTACLVSSFVFRGMRAVLHTVCRLLRNGVSLYIRIIGRHSYCSSSLPRGLLYDVIYYEFVYAAVTNRKIASPLIEIEQIIF
jgi:hypothetical protein